MTVEHSEGPLVIEGFAFSRELGTFSIGDSYLYSQVDENRVVHVLLSRTEQSLDTFIAEFGRIVGDAAADIVLYAGLTDRGRPYLVTDFLDENVRSSPSDTTAPSDSEVLAVPEVADETQLSSRTQEVDQTRLSAPRSLLDETLLSSRTQPPRSSFPTVPRTVPKSPRRVSIPTLAVTERQAVIPDPQNPAQQRSYSPREVPAEDARQGLQSQPQAGRSRAPRASRLVRERARARSALLAVAASVLLSVLGSVALILILIGR